MSECLCVSVCECVCVCGCVCVTAAVPFKTKPQTPGGLTAKNPDPSPFY